MATLKESLDQLAKGHELDNEQKKLIIDKWQKELGIQPCENAISRETVIKYIKEKCNPYGKPSIDFEAGKKAIEYFKALPSVQPKPKTGHWIDDEFGSKCSCCGIHTHLDKFDKPMKFKYCSMCGAKMVKSNMLEIPTGSESEDKE